MKSNFRLRNLAGFAGDNPGWPGQAPATASSWEQSHGKKTPAYDKKTLQRLEDLQQLEEPKSQTLFDLMDTYIRDAKARKAYAL